MISKRSGKKLIVGNWKMNPEDMASAKAIFSGIKKTAVGLSHAQTVVCPPFVYLAELGKAVSGAKGVAGKGVGAGAGKIALGAQNIFTEEAGSHTGEVSAAMVKGLGAAYVIVGHSERRARGESDEAVEKKVARALSHNLTVILCVGEHKRTEHGEYLEFIKGQLASALGKVSAKNLKHVVVAYEPVWAIGKSENEAMQPAQIHEMKIFIRKVLNDLFKSGGNGALAQKVPVLYGGSVTSRIAGAILNDGTVDGLLVGRQSLDPVEFGAILKIADVAK